MTPDSFTNQELTLDVGDGHELYIHDWGNPKAKIPVVHLHGGPGNGCKDRDKNKYDPKLQRVIFHDQRGSGKSTPLLSFENNTTADLVEDIERIAKRLAMDKFILAGGSWGSCLALAYGIKYPKRVEAMVLNGIFTGSRDEIDWLDKGGYKEFFPEIWQKLVDSVPFESQDDPTAYLLKTAFGDDPELAKRSAYTYELTELALLKLDDMYQPDPFDTYEPGAILIEMHYMNNGCFMPDDFILENAGKLTMPIWLVQGRFDMVCRPAASARLDKELPNSHLVWTINGHAAQHESNTIQQLLRLNVVGGN